MNQTTIQYKCPVCNWSPSANELVIQRCNWCGEFRTTPLSPDDSPIKVLSVASIPLSCPPFPIEKMEELTKIMGGRGDTGWYYYE